MAPAKIEAGRATIMESTIPNLESAVLLTRLDFPNIKLHSCRLEACLILIKNIQNKLIMVPVTTLVTAPILGNFFIYNAPIYEGRKAAAHSPKNKEVP